MAAFTRTEESDELIDLANTGDVMLAIKSIRIALTVTDEDSPGGTIRDDITVAVAEWVDDVFKAVALRTTGIVSPGASTSLKVEYAPGTDEVDFTNLFGSAERFKTALKALYLQTQDLPAFPKKIACEYVITYGFVSEYLSEKDRADRTLKLPASCQTVSVVGEQHLQSFCRTPGSDCEDISQQ